MKAKYIKPFTDFWFKNIFGEEASKPMLIDFLNALLPQQNKIAALSFKNTEQLARWKQIERLFMISTVKIKMAKNLLLSFKKPNRIILMKGPFTMLHFW